MNILKLKVQLFFLKWTPRFQMNARALHSREKKLYHKLMVAEYNKRNKRVA